MGEGETTPPLEPPKQAALEKLFADLPEDFEQRQEALERLRRAFLLQLVAKYRDQFWEQVRPQPQLSRHNRLSLTTAMRERLQRLGLSLAEPTTGRPGTLVVNDSSPDTRGVPSYQLVVHNDRGEADATAEFPFMPELEVVAKLPPLTKPFFRWPGSRQPDSPGR